MHQVRAQVELACEVEFLALLGALVEREQTPLGGLAIEMGEPQLRGERAAFGNEERQRCGVGAGGEMLAAVVEPEDGDGHGVIDGGLRLALAAADHGDALGSAAQQAARADGPEGVLEIGGGGEAVERPAGKGLGERALQGSLIGGAHGLERRGRAPLGLGADLEARGFGLAEAQDGELEDSVLDLRTGGATHNVGLLRPDLQQAAVALRCSGVMRGGKVE